MKFTNKDGELRIYEGGASNYYCTVLFTQADLSFPLQREKVEEQLTLDRGNYDQNANYHEGMDDPIIEPLPITFSGLIDDTSYTNTIVSLLSGVTTFNSFNAGIDNPVVVATTKASSTLNIQNSAESTIAFADTSKTCYNIEVLWDTSGTTYGFKLTEVYFPPGQQTISEGADGVILNANGMWYGSATTIGTNFTSGTSI